MSEQLAELGNQLKQEQVIQQDLKKRFEESSARATEIQSKLNQLALDASEGGNDGEACPA
mgnify:FL=1|tara:strand:- start:28 stop:207 length:180 start_codon:yes stop_codon:yes gene_type:complete